MLISVLDDFGKEIFHGEAEEFLFKKENDVELEIYKLNPWEEES